MPQPIIACHYNFCTLFDSHYLYKGLALHESLQKHVGSYHLWILCLDELVYKILRKLHLPNVSLVRLKAFEQEDKALFATKTTRTLEEYYWTMSPCWPKYLLHTNPRIDHIVYIDADLFFYSDPAPIFQELSQGSILIVPHRFPDYFRFKESGDGKFNVSLVVFRRDENSQACLDWWRQKCLEWCYRNPDKGRLGDQLYLNVWPKKFRGVHQLQHKGAGLAPWNLMNYRLTDQNGTIAVDGQTLIFYHFHGLRLLAGDRFDLAPYYEINGIAKRLIYRPYIRDLLRAKATVENRFTPGVYGIMPNRSVKSRFQELIYIGKLKVINWLNQRKQTQRYIPFFIGGTHE